MLKIKENGGAIVATAPMLLTLDALMAYRAEAVAEWRRARLAGLVLDYRASELQLTPAQWDLAIKAGTRWTFCPSIPCATVVAARHAALFEAHSARWADAGIVMLTFTSLDAAIAWAIDRRRPTGGQIRQHGG